MKWINEKTVQGEPNDSNLTEVGKAIKLANSIVYCKDCKYWAEFTFNVPPFNYCGRLFQDGNTESIGFYMEADDFCSKGERKDD